MEKGKLTASLNTWTQHFFILWDFPSSLEERKGQNEEFHQASGWNQMFFFSKKKDRTGDVFNTPASHNGYYGILGSVPGTAFKELESIVHVSQLYKCQTALWKREEAKNLSGFLD